jgi:anti-anti-sigma factor
MMVDSEKVGSAPGLRHELAVAGDLDLHTVGDVEAAAAQYLRDPASTELAVDLSRVNFIDSTGVGTLVRLRIKSRENGKALVLRRPSAQVRRILDMTSLAATFTIEP